MRRGEGQYGQDPSLWSRPGREGGHGDEEAERYGSRADHRTVGYDVQPGQMAISGQKPS